ncbi:MAG: ABC transporter substrate-binding protein, partial [Gammaproteobacteria bacterium]|nr:ABC transporter substrate-binding protein [Gammaproteobacteria bacterium]
MSKRRVCLISVFFAAVASVGLYSLANAQLETPEDVVRATAESILQSMADRKDYLAAHPAELYRLVDSIFLPRFDRNYAAYLVLGRHVRAASAEQRSRFTTALYDYILNRYAQGLLSFTSDRLQILPYRDAPGEDRATVRTFVILDNGRRIPVNYDLRLSDVGWRLYDIAIDGISYVRNLRSQLGAEIEQNGLDSVIVRLEAYRVDP